MHIEYTEVTNKSWSRIDLILKLINKPKVTYSCQMFRQTDVYMAMPMEMFCKILL
jgi:hypothetical protein